MRVTGASSWQIPRIQTSGISESLTGFYSRRGLERRDESALVCDRWLLYVPVLHARSGTKKKKKAANIVLSERPTKRAERERARREAVSHKLRALSQPAGEHLSTRSACCRPAHASSSHADRRRREIDP